jgi:hypothetical protein
VLPGLLGLLVLGVLGLAARDAQVAADGLSAAKESLSLEGVADPSGDARAAAPRS